MRRVVEHVGVVRRENDRRRPLEAVAEVLRRHPPNLGIGLDRANLARGTVEAGDGPAGAPGEDDVRVVGPDHRDPALHAADAVPVLELQAHPVVGGPARHRNHLPGVLRRAVDPVGELVVHAHPVHLGSRLVQLARPGASPVPGDVRAAVVPLDHDPVVARIDPEVVVVAVWSRDEIEGFAGVVRAVEVTAHHVDPVHIHRIGVDVHVVPGPVLELAVAVDELEGRAGVVRAIDAAVPRLDERPHPVRVCSGDGDPSPPDHPRGQAVREFRPGIPARPSSCRSRLPHFPRSWSRAFAPRSTWSRRAHPGWRGPWRFRSRRSVR